MSSLGGFGHTAAAKTLKELLPEEYEFSTIYPINELRIWRIPSAESFYNAMIASNLNRLMNWIALWVAPNLIKSRFKKTENIVRSHIAKERPDLVISLIPFVNHPASEAARKEGIPFLLITTDNDLRNWVYGLKKLERPNFQVTIGSDLPSTRELLIHQGVNPHAIQTIGLPLRPGFVPASSKNYLRTEHHIPQDRGVILLMMGGTGASNAFVFAKQILKMPENVS